MSVTLDLPDHVLRRLAAEADRRGVPLAAVVTELVEHLPPADEQPVRRLAFIGVGASAGGITHRIDELLDEGSGRD
ncbi:hypothetical protein GCM10009682_22310 [Luedemannella flava]|uniref:CopG family transcriptional regulator n=1 Tax=Luedemannella flava TaxID=349316 RepID=A0ABN2LVP0_9ACTN